MKRQPTAQVRELREQIRADVREERERVEARPLPRGVIRLCTDHVPTDVRVADIMTVRQVRPPAGPLAHLRGLVELHDGTRYHVPDARTVIDDIHRVRKDLRA